MPPKEQTTTEQTHIHIHTNVALTFISTPTTPTTLTRTTARTLATTVVAHDAREGKRMRRKKEPSVAHIKRDKSLTLRRRRNRYPQNNNAFWTMNC